MTATDDAKWARHRQAKAERLEAIAAAILELAEKAGLPVLDVCALVAAAATRSKESKQRDLTGPADALIAKLGISEEEAREVALRMRDPAHEPKEARTMSIQSQARDVTNTEESPRDEARRLFAEAAARGERPNIGVIQRDVLLRRAAAPAAEESVVEEARRLARTHGMQFGEAQLEVLRRRAARSASSVRRPSPGAPTPDSARLQRAIEVCKAAEREAQAPKESPREEAQRLFSEYQARGHRVSLADVQSAVLRRRAGERPFG